MLNKSNVLAILVSVCLPFQVVAADSSTNNTSDNTMTESRNIEVQNINTTSKPTQPGQMNQTVQDPTITQSLPTQDNSTSGQTQPQ
ncbi:MAG: hypothetical protein U1E78_01535 [Gammaproteobacteria bacterium]